MHLIKLGTMALAVIMTFALPSQSRAAEVSGDDIAKCRGLYNYLIADQRNSSGIKNKESWSDKLVFWSMEAVRRSGKGESQPTADSKKKEIAELVNDLGDNQTVVTAFLNGGIDRCEGLEEQVPAHTESAATKESAGTIAQVPGELSFESAMGCAGFYLVSAVASEPAEKKRLGDIALRWAGLAERRKHRAKAPVTAKMAFDQTAEKLASFDDKKAMKVYVDERFKTCRGLQAAHASEFDAAN